MVWVFKVFLGVLRLCEFLHNFEALVAENWVILFPEPRVALIFLQEVFLMLLLMQSLILLVFGLQLWHMSLLAVLELLVSEKWL